jgi:hypothetical protein
MSTKKINLFDKLFHPIGEDRLKKTEDAINSGKFSPSEHPVSK